MKFLRIAAITLMVGLLEGQAHAQVCGDGLVTGGEACDVAATLSGTDECADGCADDCTLTQECGVTLCEDGIDNDGDGLVDSDDPECTSLLELQPMAVAGTSPVPWGIKMGMKAEVQSCDASGNCGLASGRTLATTEPYPFGDSKADVCTTSIQMQYAILEGSLVAADQARFFGPEGYTGVASDFVTDTGLLPDMRGEFPKIGPPIGLCLDGVTPCLVDEHCPPPIACEGRLDLQDPTNTAVDLFGTGTGASHLADCNTVLSTLDAMAAQVGSLGSSGTDLKIKTGQVATVGPLAPGPNVRNYQRVRLARHAKLTIDGPADSALVAVLSRGLRLGRDATIELTGGILPRNVLFALAGNRGTLSIGREARASGTMLAPGRSLAVLGWESVLDGSVFARSVRMKERSRVRHTPFTGLLPTDLAITGSDSPDPVTAGNLLTYSLTAQNNGFAWAPAVTVTDTLDSDVTFVSATASQGPCVHDGSGTGGVVRCFVGALADQAAAPSNQATITVTVRVNCDARTSVGSTATISAQTAELAPADNTLARTTTVVEDAALVVSASDSIDPVEEGTGLAYTITVQNTGTSSCARSVSIADTLPAALVGESVSIAPGSLPGCAPHLACTATCPGGVFPCSVSILPPGQTVTIQVTGGTVADATSVLGNTSELVNPVSATSPDATASDSETTDVVRNQGDSCAGGTGADCTTASCVDGFCCGGGCSGTCEACNVPGSQGTCTGIAANTDAVNECVALCSVCDGNGGSGAGACTPATNGSDPNSECATATQDSCGFDGQCNGAGACRFYAAGTACLDQSDTPCSNPNTCSGTGTCLLNHEPATTLCSGSSQGGVCDDDASDHCSGSADSCTDVFKAASVVCRADAGQCDVAELCTGSSGACPANAFEPVSTACTGSSQGGVCDNDASDRCSGSANTCNDAFQAASVVCRADAGQCDVAELCTGSNGACPADVLEPNTTACTGSSQGGICDNDASDRCSGSANSCNDAFQAASVVCRADAGQCDIAETCTGSSGACPVNAFEPNTTSCTGSSQGGVCDNDAADTCSGTANTCNDAFQAASVVCRSGAGTCDIAESCTGVSGACPADGFVADGTSCSPPVAGICSIGVCTPTTVVVFLTSTGANTWTVPLNWNNANNQIAVIGAGGGGGGNQGNTGNGGGGGGAFALKNNLTLTPGSSVDYTIAAGGASTTAVNGNSAGFTFFNTASYSGTPLATVVAADGGDGNSGRTGGAGGQSASSSGDTVFSGGSGGTATSLSYDGGGGGGAAGADGNGGSGGAGDQSGGGGGGGGGSGGGASGSGGQDGVSVSAGGAGGNNSAGAGAGVGYVGGPYSGRSGTVGGGGQGAQPGVQTIGGNGGAGADYTATAGGTAGPGGGGGSGNSAAGGSGGTYGGGGGAAGGGGSGFLAGGGGQGLIVITYTP